METKYTEDQFEEFEKYDALSDQDVFTKISFPTLNTKPYSLY